jgi:nitroreductase
MENVLEKKARTNEVLKNIYERRAIRKFKDQPVDKKIIEQLIEAGRMAPSAMNHQPWSFYVLTDKADIKLFSKEIARSSLKDFTKMSVKDVIKSAAGLIHALTELDFKMSEDMVFHGAPSVIFITAPKDNEWAPLDVGMCAQNMMLAAHSLGLATCPIGFAKYAEYTKDYQMLRIPEDEHILLAVIAGYGDEQPTMHERRKNNVIFLNG